MSPLLVVRRATSSAQTSPRHAHSRTRSENRRTALALSGPPVCAVARALGRSRPARVDQLGRDAVRREAHRHHARAGARGRHVLLHVQRQAGGHVPPAGLLHHAVHDHGVRRHHRPHRKATRRHAREHDRGRPLHGDRRSNASARAERRRCSRSTARSTTRT